MTDSEENYRRSSMNWSVISRVAPYGIRRPSGPYTIQLSLSLTLSLLCRHSFGYMISWHSWLLLGSAISKLDTKTSSVTSQVQNRTHSQRYRDRNRSAGRSSVITRPMSFVYEKLSRNLESRSHVVRNIRNAIYCVPRYWVFCKLCF